MGQKSESEQQNQEKLVGCDKDSLSWGIRRAEGQQGGTKVVQGRSLTTSHQQTNAWPVSKQLLI